MIFINTICNEGGTKLNSRKMLVFTVNEIDVAAKVK
jgi:hypothetical protein